MVEPTRLAKQGVMLGVMCLLLGGWTGAVEAAVTTKSKTVTPAASGAKKSTEANKPADGKKTAKKKKPAGTKNAKSPCKDNEPEPQKACANKMKKLGGRTRFVRIEPKTVRELKELFEPSEKKPPEKDFFKKDVRRVLKERGLGDDVADQLFAKVAGLDEKQQPELKPVPIPVGTRFEWMAYRKNGKPGSIPEPCWDGKKPFDAWVLQGVGKVDDKFDGYTFVVPVACGNIALLEPPTCLLKATQTCGKVLFDLSDSRPGGVPLLKPEGYGGTVTRSDGKNAELTRTDPADARFEYPYECTDAKTCHYTFAFHVQDQIGLSSPGTQCVYEADVCPTTPPTPPVCKISAKNDCQKKEVTIDMAGSTDGAEISVSAENKKLPQDESGKYIWSYKDKPAAANYRFEAVVTAQGISTKCEAVVQVCEAPVCKLHVTRDPDSGQVKIDIAGSSAQRTTPKVTSPQGDDVQPQGAGDLWSFQPAEPGTYQVSVTATNGICPESAECATDFEVVPCCDYTPWTARLYGAALRVSENTFFETLSAHTAKEERRQYKIGGTKGGFGLGVEYRARTKDGGRVPWGFSFDVIDSSMDVHFMLDTQDIWAMDKDAVRVMPILLGASYHFVRKEKADLWIGPSAGWVEYGDASFSTTAGTFKERFNSDFAYGVGLGADFALGDKNCWLLTAGLRYLKASSDVHGTSNFKMDVDPLVATLGIGYRF
jgi:hypothetical protein